MMKKKQNSAFTFIELAIVVAVIAILVSVVIYGANSLVSIGNINRARAITSSSPVSQIDGLVAWYETSSKDSFIAEQTIDKSQISEWRDISPYSQALRNTTSPTNVLTTTASANVLYSKDGINGLPSIKFTTAGYIKTTSIAQGISSQSTIFLVFNSPSYPTGSPKMIFDAGTLPVTRIGLHKTRLHLNAGNSGDTTNSTDSDTLVGGVNYIVVAYFNQANSKFYLNDAINIWQGIIDSGTATLLRGVTIGALSDGTSGFDGLVSEVIVFNRILNLNERKAVMAYLSKKYKIYVNGV